MADLGQQSEDAKSLYEQLRGITLELKGQETAISKSRKAFRAFEGIAQSLKLNQEDISRLNDKELGDLSNKLTIQQSIAQQEGARLVNQTDIGNLLSEEVATLQAQGATQDQINDLVQGNLSVLTDMSEEQKALVAAYFDEYSVIQNINGELDKELQRRENINKSLGVAGNVLKGIKGIGGKFAEAFGLDQVSADMEEFADKMATVNSRASRLSVLGVGIKSAFGQLGNTLTDPSVIIGGIVKSFGEFEKANTEVRNLTGQSASNMEVFSTSMTSTIDAAKTIGSLSKEIGINVNAAFSASTITAASELTNLLGVSEKSAANLALRAEAFGGTLKGVDESVFNTVKGFNIQNRAAVNVGAVLEDVGNASNTLALSLGGSSDELAEAAAGAQRLGLNLASAEKIADTLLDFETSIANELQAELLTGKEINLEGARQAALNNDIAALTKEIGDNQEILSAFSSGNRIQQDAIAKSLGMSKDEVAKMIFLRQKENNLTDEQAAKAAGINIETAKRLGAQDSIQKSIEKITAALAPTLAVIADGIAMITGNTGGLIATFGVMAFALLPKLVNGAKDLAAGFRDSAKIVSNLATKGIKGMTDGLSTTTGAAAKTSKSLAGAPGKGIRSFFKNLAGGLRSMGTGPVLKGVLALALFAPAALIATAAIPFLAFIAIPGVGAGISAGLIGIGSGLAALGAVASSGVAFLAPLLLLSLGAAMIPFALSLRLLTPLVEAFGAIFIGVFNALPPIISAVAEGIVTIFGGIGDLISTVVGELISLADPTIALGLYMIAPALAVLGLSMIPFAYGLGLLGGALLLAAPGLVIGSFTLPLIAPAIIQLGEALKGIDTSSFSQLGLSVIPFAAGLGILGGALLLAAPGLVMGSFTLPLIAPAIMQLGDTLKEIDISLFSQLGFSVIPFAAGLTLLGGALLLAAPGLVIGSFTLPLIAPAIMQLGEALKGIDTSSFLQIGLSFIPFAAGLTLLGGALLLASPGLAILGGFGLALMSFSTALGMAVPSIEAIGTVLATTIMSIADAVVTVMPAITQGLIDLATQIPIANLLALAVALPSLAFGLGILGGALSLAAPGLLIGSSTLPLIGPAITQLGDSLKGIDTSLFFQFGIGIAALTAAFAIAGTAFPLIIGGSFALSMALTPLTAVLMAAAPSMSMFSDAITTLGSIDYSNLLGLAEVLPALALGIGAFALTAAIFSVLTGGNPFGILDGLAENAPGIDLASNALSNMSIALGNLQTALAGVDTEKLSDVMNPGLGGVVLGLGTSAIQGVTDAVGSIAGALGGGGEEEGNQAIVAELQEVKVLLSQILNKEGAVNIDSTKAGTAFSMGTSRLQ